MTKRIVGYYNEPMVISRFGPRLDSKKRQERGVWRTMHIHVMVNEGAEAANVEV